MRQWRVCVWYRPGPPPLLSRRVASHVRVPGPLLSVLVRRVGANQQSAVTRGLAGRGLLHPGGRWENRLPPRSALPRLKRATLSLFAGSGAGMTPAEGYESTVGGYLQQQQLSLQQHNQLQQLQQLHQYQQQQLLVQYQQQQQVPPPPP